MPPVVVSEALMMCPFGAAPVPLQVIPEGSLVTAGLPVATIMDHIPLVNIMPFGTCVAPANPATFNPAKIGPCVPNTPAPWSPMAPTVLVNDMPILTLGSVCECMWGGVIEITDPGQVQVEAQ